ncbi:MAG TPA: class I SAM-dependent methyltransferase [Ktedonobacteraceae bacterium]|nr:class I SAM-dependent methyltransferase [Ktedonobacteraceae bacterium]
MTPHVRKSLFETLYKNRYLYRFASTVPFAGQWRVWQKLVLPRIVGHDVLEFGCGLGDLLADMLTAGYNCYAVEQSPQMVVAARATLKRLALGTPATVIQGSAQHVPFSDSSFDTVVSTFPSEYIYDPDTITEVERVLRPGGRLIVIEGANLLPVGFLQPFLVLLQMFVYGPSVLFKDSKRRNGGDSDGNQAERILYTDRTTASGITTQVIPNADFGQLIPLEKHGLRRRSELVRSRRWEVYITIGEKP